MRTYRLIAGLLLLALVAACSPGPAEKPPYPGIKLGKPYEVSGRWYKPHYNPQYDEIGIASWYGPGFHGGRTATGERYDQNDLTAAHRTLPLPSIVRVTNLDNGRSAVIRINDRGPFAHDRIIDLSKGAAIKLGVIRTGTAKVRVQFLEQETRAYVQNILNGNPDAMRYANTSVYNEHAGMQGDENEPPQLKIQTKMFGQTPEEAAAAQAPEQVSMNTVQTAPLPPVVQEENEPQPAPSQDIFSVVDDGQGAAPQAQYEPSAPEQPRAASASALAPASGYVPAASGGSFYVQAGTFGVKGNATRLQNRLSGMGAVQTMEVLTGGNRKLYRVMMGPFAGENDARNMLSKITAGGISDAKIIRN